MPLGGGLSMAVGHYLKMYPYPHCHGTPMSLDATVLQIYRCIVPITRKRTTCSHDFLLSPPTPLALTTQAYISEHFPELFENDSTSGSTTSHQISIITT